jgi:hypothetical protein
VLSSLEPKQKYDSIVSHCSRRLLHPLRVHLRQLSEKVDQWRHEGVTVEAMVLMAVEEARGSTLVSNWDLI